MTKRIFLTGATGNAGPAAVAELQRRNYEVTALVRGYDAHSGCREVHGCLDRLADLHDEIAAADGIVHLASPRGNTRDSVVFDDILGTGELLDAWSHGNFVYASSQIVYGIPNLPLDESAPVDAQCWYDLGKVANEFQIQMTKAEDDGARGHAISLRMALLFGATYRRRDRQFLPAVYDHCRNGSGFVFDSEEGLEAYGSRISETRTLRAPSPIPSSWACRARSTWRAVSARGATWLKLFQMLFESKGASSSVRTDLLVPVNIDCLSRALM